MNFLVFKLQENSEKCPDPKIWSSSWSKIKEKLQILTAEKLEAGHIWQLMGCKMTNDEQKSCLLIFCRSTNGLTAAERGTSAAWKQL